MQLRFIAGAAAIAMLGIALSIRFAPQNSSLTIQMPTTSTEETTILDSDGDGAPNWQETLLGTDPNDAGSVPERTALTATLGATATSSLTEQFARSFLYQYLTASGGGSKSVENPTLIGVSLATSLQVPSPKYTPYTSSDIKLAANTDAARLYYYEAMQKVLGIIQHQGEPELAVYSRLIDGEPAAKENLEAIILLYTKAATEAVSASAPSEAKDIHLATINALGYYAASLLQLIEYSDDPVGSLTVLRAYNSAEAGIFSAFDALRIYFASHSITS